MKMECNIFKDDILHYVNKREERLIYNDPHSEMVTTYYIIERTGPRELQRLATCGRQFHTNGVGPHRFFCMVDDDHVRELKLDHMPKPGTVHCRYVCDPMFEGLQKALQAIQHYAPVTDENRFQMKMIRTLLETRDWDSIKEMQKEHLRRISKIHMEE